MFMLVEHSDVTGSPKRQEHGVKSLYFQGLNKQLQS